MAGADYGELIYRNGIYQPDADHLGADRVLVYFHKNYPRIVIAGAEVDAEEYLTWKQDADDDGYVWTDTDEGEYLAIMPGYRFQARHVGGNMLDAELIEPDGTIWQTRAGYRVGEAWLDEYGDGTPEQFYQRMMSHRFQWTSIHTPTA